MNLIDYILWLISMGQDPGLAMPQDIVPTGPPKGGDGGGTQGGG